MIRRVKLFILLEEIALTNSVISFIFYKIFNQLQKIENAQQIIKY
jgi:hypothetical protein